MASLRKTETTTSSSLALGGPSTELTLGTGSSFQSATTVDVDGDRRGKKKISTKPPLPQDYHRHADVIIVEDDDDDYAPEEEDKIFEVGDGSGTQHRSGEGQRSPRRLQEVMARRRINRLSAQRSRAKKNEYVAQMERQAKYLENKVAVLHPQVKAYENQRRLLLIEQHEVKYRMAMLEKDRLLKEIEAEKMRHEITRLLELQKHQEQIRAQDMRTWGSDIKLMCADPNPCLSNKPLVDSTPSVEAKVVEASEMEVDDDKANSLRKKNGKEKASS